MYLERSLSGLMSVESLAQNPAHSKCSTGGSFLLQSMPTCLNSGFHTNRDEMLGAGSIFGM